VQSGDKLRKNLIFLAILEGIFSVFIILVSDIAFAQTLHNKTLYEMVKQKPLTEIFQLGIGEGKSPNAIAIDGTTNTAYVANGLSDSVSVISTEDNIIIGEDIPVGNRPVSITLGPGDIAYVPNRYSDSVSVISTENHTKIAEDIPVGNGPVSIAIDGNTKTS
jgi:YVTN family beta-propeller protein